MILLGRYDAAYLQLSLQLTECLLGRQRYVTDRRSLLLVKNHVGA